MSANRPYVKKGLTPVTPFVAVPDIPSAIAFYARLFGAVDVRRDAGPDGTVQHAVLEIDGDPIELGRHGKTARSDLSDVLPPVGLHLFVADVDAVYARARDAGATGHPPTDMPYGDREAAVLDPFGVTWWIATTKE